MNDLHKNSYKRLHFSVYGVEFSVNSNSNFYINEFKNDFKYFKPKSELMRFADFSITIHLINNSEYFPLNLQLKFRLNSKQTIGSKNQKFRILKYKQWHIIENESTDTVYSFAPKFRTAHIFTINEDTEIYHAISDIVMNFLSMFLLRRNTFCIHAAALSKDNMGFLFPGRSGSGKTTISLSLVKSGYKFLSDDYPLVRSSCSKFEILAFPQRLKVRNDTLRNYSELIAYTKRKKLEMTRPFIDVSEVFLGCLTKEVEVFYLIFPNLTNSQKTSYVEISKNEALKKLLPCMYDPFSNFEPSLALRKLIFEFSYNLVSKIDCYNLFLGINSYMLGEILGGLAKR